ncbi:MAG: folylpolyglutamate synthase/dihydrofolate synthase family protein [Henriciella sp.]|nr:folylpolyglutamate synthase/dihydrofolate synthase family protein [Henriciella sp.]
MTVAAALKRFEGLHPQTIELSLGRIKDVLETLGRPQDKLPPVFHVAGTNGKGSTCAFLRAMAEAAGLRAHVFTSPHLVRFNERIRLAGTLIKDAQLEHDLTRVYDALEGRPITHFEATTATALLCFSEAEADLLILEVGLGGRFDATNVIDAPAVSVITPVDYDHAQFLGNDLGGIAGEKAGIIKAGCPAVSARQPKVCREVISAKAKQLGADLKYLSLEDIERVPEQVALIGTHQRKNAALAGLALRSWRDRKISDAAIWKGAGSAEWPARLQHLKPGPLTELAGRADVWLDGGHNAHAAAAINEALDQMGGTTILVCAMMASKDHDAYFRALRGAITEVHTLPNAPGHAGAEPDDLARKASDQFDRATPHANLENALRAAAATNPDRILISGSLYLAGEVLEKNHEVPT